VHTRLGKTVITFVTGTADLAALCPPEIKKASVPPRPCPPRPVSFSYPSRLCEQFFVLPVFMSLECRGSLRTKSIPNGNRNFEASGGPNNSFVTDLEEETHVYTRNGQQTFIPAATYRIPIL